MSNLSLYSSFFTLQKFRCMLATLSTSLLSLSGQWQVLLLHFAGCLEVFFRFIFIFLLTTLSIQAIAAWDAEQVYQYNGIGTTASDRLTVNNKVCQTGSSLTPTGTTYTNYECPLYATASRPYWRCRSTTTGPVYCDTNSSNPCTSSKVWNLATQSCEVCSGESTNINGVCVDPVCDYSEKLIDHRCMAPPVPNDPQQCQAANDAPASRSNPILLGTGSKFQAETDFSSTISSLAISRQYYSLGKQGSWTWSLESKKLSLYDQAAVTATNLTATAYNASGFAFAYLMRSGGVNLQFKYVGGTGKVWQSTGLQNITLTESIVAQQVQYVVTNVSGAKEIYNNSGRLIETIGVNGRHQIYATFTNIDALPDIDKLTITDISSGQSISYVYNDAGQIIQAQDPAQQTYTYGYTGVNLTTVTFPDNSVVTYHYEKTGSQSTLLTGITDETVKRFATWDYDANGRAKDSKHGENDPDPNAPFEHGTLGYTVVAGDVTSVAHTNAKGRVTNYTLAQVKGRNMVTQVNGIAINTCLASNSHYSYDTNGYRKTFTDGKGNVVESIRNSRGLIETERTGLQWVGGVVDSTLVETSASQKTVTTWKATEALPLTRTYYGWNSSTSAYEAYKNETTTYTSNNRIETFTVTDLTTITSPYATNGRTRVWTYGYSYYDTAQTQLQQQTVNGPRTDVSDITTYNYDAVGNLTSTVNALNQPTIYSGHNARGLVGDITDVNGILTHMTYTLRGWLDTVTVNGTALTDYDYYANGLLKKVTMPDNSWLFYTYNEAHHLIKVQNNLGESIEYTPSILDGKWTSEKVKDASANANIIRERGRVFDELGRIMDLQGQNGQSWDSRYDENDNLISENDALQQLTTYEYDTQNRISETFDAEQNAKVDPLTRNSITYTYDIQGNIRQVWDQKNGNTTYVYDGFGELIKEYGVDAGATTFTYDANGNLTNKVDARGVSVSYQYDALNRLKATLHVGNPSEDVNYTYDSIVNGNKGVGRLTGYADNNGTTMLTYDAWGLYTNLYCMGLQCYGTDYNHNSTGQLTSLVYPSGNSVIYGYDTLGRVNAVSYQQIGEPLAIIASAIEYHPFGAMKKITYSNGVVLDIGNDTDGRVNPLTATGTNLLFGKGYEFTLANNIQTITDLKKAQNNRAYTYDKVSRLKTAIKGAVNPVTTSYTYDEVGNRKTKKVSDSYNNLWLDEMLTIPIHHNKVTKVTDAVSGKSKTYTYDAAGNTTLQANSQGTSIVYTYNDGNRMSVSNVSNGMLTSYVYNTLGQRIVKIPNGDFDYASYYHYGDAGKLLSEHNLSSGQMLIENVYVNGIMLAQMDPKVDSDGDGLLDTVDSYPNIALGSRTDTDQDGIPNDCDATCLALGMTADLDNDDDGVPDVNDAYPNISLGWRLDTDEDGIPNDCDAACVSLGMVADLDDDGDTMPDIWEVTHGFNPLVANGDADFDADGYYDWLEYVSNTLPNNAASHPDGLTPTITTDLVSASDYKLSLREAVIKINTSTLRKINVPALEYTLTLVGADEDNSVTGDLDIKVSNVHIVGIDPATSIIDGNGADRVLNIRNTDNAIVENITIQHGLSGLDNIGGAGIAVESSINLQLNNVIIKNNNGSVVSYQQDSTVDGGGLFVSDGCVAINNSIISNNMINSPASTGNAIRGGGIYIKNPVCNSSINNTLISSNSITTSGVSVEGGGLYISGAGNKTHAVSNSTLSNNIITTINAGNAEGAGIYIDGSTLELRNSTISSNEAQSSDNSKAGGLFTSSATISLYSNTFYLNKAIHTGQYAAPALIDMIHFNSSTGLIRNNIFAGTNALNFSTLGVSSNGYNLFQTNSIAGLTLQYTDIIGLDPLLETLAYNGSSTTLTHALKANSPAIDAGSTVLTTDQRNEARPQDGNGNGVALADIGAYERRLVDDAVLNDKVHLALLINNTVPLTTTDLSYLTFLDLSNSAVKSLEGLQYASNNMMNLYLTNTAPLSLVPLVGKITWWVTYTGITLPPYLDSDDDSYPDTWEIANGFNPLNIADRDPGLDTDGDGVPDGKELMHGLNISNPLDTMTDTDNDGYSLGQELVQGSNPLSNASIPLNQQYIIPIVSGADDVESRSTGSNFIAADEQLNLESGTKDTVGLRFTLPLSKGQVVNSAVLEVISNASSGGSTSASIALENIVDSTVPTSNFALRNYFASTVLWYPAEWDNNGIYQTPDLSGLLNQAINLSGWQKNNHILFKLTRTDNGGKLFKAYEYSDHSKAPKLIISSSPAKWDYDSDGIFDAVDNCPINANASQLNTDGDSRGDACDAFPNDPTKI